MSEQPQIMNYDLVVVGGGIAGVTCVETLSAYCEDLSVLLITASPVVKAVSNFVQASEIRESFDVEERPSCYLEEQFPNVKVLQDLVTSVRADDHVLLTGKGLEVRYKKLCLCSGGKPKLISANPFVVGIRDTESVKDLQQRLGEARRVVLIGNGGIATEFVYKVHDLDVVWCVKDESISAAFVDAGAAEFFLPLVGDQAASEASADDKQPRKRLKFTQSDIAGGAGLQALGEALGPDWHENLSLKGTGSTRTVKIEYKVEISGILTPEEYGKEKADEHGSGTSEDWAVYVKLTNGQIYGCDVVVSATGVTPNTDLLGPGHCFKLANDGGILVDDRMRTDRPDVYGAGDVITASWETAKHWHQMRLWTQARQMGFYASKCIHADLNGEELLMDICFDLFAHSTRFFGFKVILLGLYNAQKLGIDYELLLRMTKGVEYVKVVLQNGRMQGAILIGETDLEEVFEHLILNETDLSPYGEDLLDPNIDIEDYFD